MVTTRMTSGSRRGRQCSVTSSPACTWSPSRSTNHRPPVRRTASADTDQEPSRRAPSGSAVRSGRAGSNASRTLPLSPTASATPSGAVPSGWASAGPSDHGSGSTWINATGAAYLSRRRRCSPSPGSLPTFRPAPPTAQHRRLPARADHVECGQPHEEQGTGASDGWSRKGPSRQTRPTVVTDAHAADRANRSADWRPRARPAVSGLRRPHRPRRRQ